MTFQGAVIREQGQVFAVVIVKKHIVDNSGTAAETIRSFQPAFPGMPVVLMVQDSRGTPTYYGRRDIARFLASISISRIPWRQFTLN